MPAHPLPAPLTAADGANAGTVAHAVVAHLAGDARGLPPHELTERVLAAVGRLCRDSNGSRRRAVWAEAASTAVAYLRLMPPPDPWALLGAEVSLGDGRADVVWEHPDLGVLVDELKSGRTAAHEASQGWVEQARRYARAAAAEHRERALGVRLFVAGSPAASLLVPATGSPVPLLGSAFCPRRLDEEAAGR